MIDHLICCTTAGEADALVAQYGPSRAYQPRVILAGAVYDGGDPPELVTPEVLASGYFVGIVLDEIDESLRDLPDHACRLIVDRAAVLAGRPDWLIYRAPDLDDVTLATARVEPMVAGSAYPTMPPAS